MIQDKDKRPDEEEEEEIDLAALVDAIRSSSDAELNVLSDISTTIEEVKDLLSGSADLAKKSHKMAQKEHKAFRRNQSKSKRKDNQLKNTSSSSSSTLRPNEVELTVVTPPTGRPQDAQVTQKEKDSPSQPVTPLTSQDGTETPKPATPLTSQDGTETPQITIPLTSQDGTEASQVIQTADHLPVQAAESTKAVADIADSADQSMTATTQAMQDFSKFWRDEKGRLRKANGQFASKKEKSDYEKSAQNTAREREEEKRNGVLVQLLSKGKDALTKTGESDAAEVGGAAAGGTYFYAAKEIFDLSATTVEKVQEITSESEDGDDKSLLANLYSKLTSTQQPSEPTKTEKAKEASGAREERELLQEQTDQQARDAAETHDKLDDVIAAIKKESGDDSLLGGILAGAVGAVDFLDDIVDLKRHVTGSSSTSSSRTGGTVDVDADIPDRDKKGKDSKTKPKGSRKPTTRPKAKVPRGRWNAVTSLLGTAKNGASTIADATGQTLTKGKGLLSRATSSISKTASALNPMTWFSKGGEVAAKGAGAAGSGAGTASKALKGGGIFAGLFGGISKFLDVKDDKELSTEQKTAQVAATAGGAGLGTAIGTSIGATLGGILGSVVPGAGTAAGAWLGGALGGAAGGAVGMVIGEDFGETISDFLGSDSSLSDYVADAWTSTTEGATELFDTAAKEAEDFLKDVSTTFGDLKDILTGSNIKLAEWMGDSSANTTTPYKTTGVAPAASAYPAYQAVKLENSRSISEIEQRQTIKTTSSTPSQVSLDDKSLKALQAVAKTANNQPKEKPTSSPTVTVRAPESSAPTNIPTDFSNRELRRQSADLE